MAIVLFSECLPIYKITLNYEKHCFAFTHYFIAFTVELCYADCNKIEVKHVHHLQKAMEAAH